MKRISLIIFIFLHFNNTYSQSINKTMDYRDSFCGTYLLYNGNCWNGVPANPSYITLLVEKYLTSLDSIIITDSLQYNLPPYKKYAKLNVDSTWYSSPSYNGNFLRVDTIHVFGILPGPSYCYYDEKKINSIGIKELTIRKSELVIFPNPSSDWIEILIEKQNEIQKFEIYDSFGRIVFDGNLNNDKKINISELNKGIYFVILSDTANILKGKFIKE